MYLGWRIYSCRVASPLQSLSAHSYLGFYSSFSGYAATEGSTGRLHRAGGLGLQAHGLVAVGFEVQAPARLNSCEKKKAFLQGKQLPAGLHASTCRAILHKLCAHVEVLKKSLRSPLLRFFATSKMWLMGSGTLQNKFCFLSLSLSLSLCWSYSGMEST